jgi:TPP-dependent pyruvate/acetoin dehydrogenase alpha subunit
MVLIRRVEESLLELAESGKIGGAMHTAIGHEGAAVGHGRRAPARRLPHLHLPRPPSLPGPRHGPKRAICEVLGKEPMASPRARAARCTLSTRALGLMGANGIVGAQVPHAAGMALASKLRGDGRIAITFFGDGALFQGLMHETFNMAPSGNCRSSSTARTTAIPK